MNYLLPPEWTTTFVPLQDRCPVSSLDSIEDMFRKDTGCELSDYFSDFSPEPVGAASLAQVHVATIATTGRRVAVKVQHPGLARWSSLDLALTSATFGLLRRFFPEYDLSWLSSEMEISLPVELDFRCEAANARRTAEHFASLRQPLPLVVPEVLWAEKRILVMACETGHRLDDLDYLDEQGFDRGEVSAALARIFNEMIFGRDAPLHCDPHGGNLAIRRRGEGSSSSSRNAGGQQPNKGPSTSSLLLPDFEIILYDHGLYRDIPLGMRRAYAKMWLAVLDGDMARMRTWAHEVAGIDDDDFPLFASAITGRDFGILSGGRRLTSDDSPSAHHLDDQPRPDSAGAAAPGSSSPSTSSSSSFFSSPNGRSLMSSSPRDDTERDRMSDALNEGGLLPSLVQMLGRVPRIVLLILKTNDLTRALDESLQRPSPKQQQQQQEHRRRRGGDDDDGGKDEETSAEEDESSRQLQQQQTESALRSFMILARYCARTVYDEEVENILGEDAAVAFAGKRRSSVSLPGGSGPGTATARWASSWLWWTPLWNRPRDALRLFAAWAAFVRVEAKLALFEFWITLRKAFGMRPSLRVGKGSVPAIAAAPAPA